MTPPTRLRRALTWAALLAVLLAVFGLYTRGDFMLDVANQLWGCFWAVSACALPPAALFMR